MYDEATDTAAHASNTAIAEDLGQIDYMFTDKTGTLTDNIMVFKRCSIGGEVFGSTEPDYTAARDQNLCEVVQAE